MEMPRTTHAHRQVEIENIFQNSNRKNMLNAKIVRVDALGTLTDPILPFCKISEHAESPKARASFVYAR